MKKHLVLLVLGGFLVGVIGLTAIRFFTFSNDDVHYHADFALYINGQRDEFKSFTFYEEIQSCTSESVDNPKTRAHMHDENSSLIHVEAHAVTWSQFFANLGYDLGDKVVATDSAVYVTGQDDSQLTFMLNGKKVYSVANVVIHSEDVLLINYGKDDQATLQQRYDSIPRDAHKANATADPASCGGSGTLTFTSRLKQAIGISQSSH